MRIVVLSSFASVLVVYCSAFSFAWNPTTRKHNLNMKYADRNEIKYSAIAVSGFISKGSNVAEAFPFLKLHEKEKYDAITAVSDDIGFAKKRMASPSTIYSGLFDVLNHVVATSAEDPVLENTLSEKEAWIVFNITSSELPVYAALAAKVKIPRVVFGIRMSPEEQGEGVVFEDTCATLAAAGTNYTIIKFGDVRPMSEAKYPYRIRRGNESVPQPSFEGGQGQLLSTQDLYRVIIECVDLSKSFNKIYSMGPGTYLDSEILVYMKAQGWPERVQVGMMLGDLMDSIERKYKEETARVAKLNPVKPLPVSASSLSAAEKTRSTGFFT